MTKLAVKLIPGGKLPVRSTEMAGAWDMFARSVELKHDDGYTRAIIRLGCAMQPADPNYRIMLQPRSSITKTSWVMQNSPGLGDPDFDQEYQARFILIPGGEDEDTEKALRKHPFNIGDRVVQMYLERIEPIEIELLGEDRPLPHQTDRTGGFGSTGKK